MTKGKSSKKQELSADVIYNDPMVTKFINVMMLKGKKWKCFKIFFKTMEILKVRGKDIKKNPLDIWKKALNNITPQVEVRPRRVGGATYQIPQEIRPERKMSLAMRWLRDYARERKEKGMAEKLAAEILDAYKEQGGAFKKKEDTHRMAEANKAFSHLRF